MPLAVDLQKNLVAVPLVPKVRTATAQLGGKLLAEFLAPLSDGFVGHDDSTCKKAFFDVGCPPGEAEGKAMIEPNSVCDDFVRKPKTFVGWSSSVCFHVESMTHLATGLADRPTS